MPSRAVWELLDNETRWAVYAAEWAVDEYKRFPRDLKTSVAYPFYFYQKWYWESYAEELDRKAWIEDVKQRLGLITMEEA